MIGIIGGTGLYQIEGLEVLESREVETPFGRPSAEVVIGRLGSKKVAFLPRHGTRHEILPGEINFRANIWALKSVGVRRVLSVSAVGSLVQEIEPGHLVIPNQYFDFTKGKRAGTFFGDGLVAHVSTAEPSCPALTGQAFDAANRLGHPVHREKTYACVEGPRLGSRAESFFLRGARCHVVGMTNVPEVFLAREAQLCYCTIAVVTDYDCWLDDPAQHATVDKVIALYKKNLGRVQAILKEVLAEGEGKPACRCRSALKSAVLTPDDALPGRQRKLLEFLKE
ncbi:MAG: S-methyl-5'-thioadenosine phosphorylase [Deltaproteobacteria bacterium]|nr:S-methyl-5'-thioadenosine phosphorylase [Deltaproteobacteria bacterium]